MKYAYGLILNPALLIAFTLVSCSASNRPLTSSANYNPNSIPNTQIPPLIITPTPTATATATPSPSPSNCLNQRTAISQVSTNDQLNFSWPVSSLATGNTFYSSESFPTSANSRSVCVKAFMNASHLISNMRLHARPGPSGGWMEFPAAYDVSVLNQGVTTSLGNFSTQPDANGIVSIPINQTISGIMIHPTQLAIDGPATGGGYYFQLGQIDFINGDSTCLNSSDTNQPSVVTSNLIFPTLTYPQNTYLFTEGTSIVPIGPTVVSGAVIAGYSITPSLPTGLSMDPATGIISGTPSIALSNTAYAVTLSSVMGNATAAIAITVVDCPHQRIPITQVFTNDQLNSSWPVSSIATGNTFYSSESFPTPANTRNVSVGASINNSYLISNVQLHARPVTGGWGAFPLAYQVYVLNQGVSTNLGNFSTQPDSNGIVSIPINQTISGIAILPTQLTLDRITTGGYYFQLGQIDFINSDPTCLPSSAITQNAPAVTNTTPTLTYPQNSYTFTQGTAITNIVPTVVSSAIITGYSIIPSLPPGLSMDPNTGIISGSPGSSLPNTTYTVTAASVMGNAQYQIQIQINAPPALSVSSIDSQTYVCDNGYQINLSANPPTIAAGSGADPLTSGMWVIYLVNTNFAITNGVVNQRNGYCNANEVVVGRPGDPIRIGFPDQNLFCAQLLPSRNLTAAADVSYSWTYGAKGVCGAGQVMVGQHTNGSRITVHCATPG